MKLILCLLLPAILLGSIVAGCQQESPQPPAEPHQATAPEKAPPADISAPPPAAPPEPLPQPIVIRGTVPSVESKGETSPVLGGDIADITINMVDADIAAVLKATLGDTLGMPYSLDQEVQGTLTLRTNKPVTQSELVASLEAALFGAGYALIYQDGRFRVTTLERAR